MLEQLGLSTIFVMAHPRVRAQVQGILQKASAAA
jgi:hypothetical protein